METLASRETPIEAPLQDNDKLPEDLGAAPKEFKSLYDQFEVEPNPRSDDALQKIWEYAKEIAPNKDKDSVVWEVIRLKNRLGSANLGDKPYAKVEAYVTAWFQMKQAEKRMEELNG